MEKNLEYKELSEEYQRSLEPIKKRIDDLKLEIKRLEAENQMKGNRKIKNQIRDIEERISTLLVIQRNLREIGAEVDNYYEKSWWRSEKYTLNSRKPKCFSPSIFNALEEEIIDQLLSDI